MTISDPRPPALSATEAYDHEITVAARSGAPVLITAERQSVRLGCARVIHAQSARRTAPFAEFDCRPWSAAEGGLTALRQRFRDASCGTLFLDGIETMADGMQAELFSLLEQPACDCGVPSPSAIRRPRIVSGAGRSLLAAIAVGTFDEALFYRLNVIHLDLTGHLSREHT